ncbi:TonB family protein [Pedobacter panaciterrae]|jgi:TonB family protein|uniref:TonB family protein n=1 Tax=Pedobacter panaciterrae TaxID=363849 RepID=A0ABU8NNW0_9SPHI|nr:TonB family protein [Pedobacter panaciterrae]NQX55425.1 TonB family protein [Pedobacter panaciterrae]
MSKILLALFLLLGLNVKAQPTLKGGLESFVMNNKVYPRYSLQNCIDGSVTISFKLNKAGEVYFSKIQKGIGTDLDDEALRLIRLSSGKWIVPADHDTTISVVVPINFKLSGDDCQNKSQKDIKQAIETYKTNVGMTDAVLNFYRHKATGKFTADEERRIVALKTSLGYDEEYMKMRINDGLKKLKQKDRQGACEDFMFVKNMGFDLADEQIAQYCN